MTTSVATLLARVEAVLADRCRELDALNVFPVPDGDTGANLLATARAAHAGALDRADDPARGAVDAAVRGARGNSGVLLSQVLRGLLGAVARHGRLDVEALVEGLEAGARLAREAIARPVEGSLLSVATAAAEASRAAAADGLVAAAAAAARAAHAATDRTPTQLDVLARAGVVDAGARGLALVLEALAGTVAGTEPAPPDVDVPDVPPDQLVAASCEDGAGRWEVMYRLERVAPTASAAVRDGLDAVGASVVVADAGDALQVHVHTDDIGAALAVGTDHGRPVDVRIEDLGADQGGGTASRGVVVVGLDAPLLTADVEAAGGVPLPVGPGRLPSVDDVLAAAERVDGDVVVVLPGHPDVVPVARQAARVAAAGDERPLAVVEAADSAPAVLSLLTELHDDPDPGRLAAGAAEVRTGRVAVAVRAADTEVGPVAPGTWLAQVGRRVVAAHDDPLGALDALLAALAAGAAAELAQVHLGRDVAAVLPDGAAVVGDRVRTALPDAHVEVVEAGQHPALVVVGLE